MSYEKGIYIVDTNFNGLIMHAQQQDCKIKRKIMRQSFTALFMCSYLKACFTTGTKCNAYNLTQNHALLWAYIYYLCYLLHHYTTCTVPISITETNQSETSRNACNKMRGEISKSDDIPNTTLWSLLLTWWLPRIR